jgi:hypothetical protein
MAEDGGQDCRRRTKLVALLDRLQPMNMLAEDGLKKASIALAVLERSTAEPGSALDLVDTPGGVRLLLQTALLHPEPSFRLGATMCVHNLVSQNEPHFLQVALDEPCMLPKALARMLAEADRSVQEAAEREEDGDAGGKKAVDPDLPVRRVALEMFSTLVQRTTPEVALRVLESEQLCTTPFALLSSSRDAQICQGAAELLLAILARDDAVAQAVRNLRMSLDKSHEKGRSLAQEVLGAQDGQRLAEEGEQQALEAEKLAKYEVDELTHRLEECDQTIEELNAEIASTTQEMENYRTQADKAKLELDAMRFKSSGHAREF